VGGHWLRFVSYWIGSFCPLLDLSPSRRLSRL
jgi:hypothetical protein